MTTRALFASIIAVLLLVIPSWATTRMPEEPLEKRVQDAGLVFVGEVINRKVLADDWCHADLKVTRAIKGVTVGELIPVQWRPKIASYDATENQVGLAVLIHKAGTRYWLRSDAFVDAKLAEEAVKILEKSRAH